ncbi:hypothetical protein BS78_02G017000 [Paspalum vaginatum]|nr:hypothetical protein BS78_02G017000 [Paspalum vaginatum]
MLAGDVSVVKSFPEDFLVTFTHRHHRDAAVACRDFPYGSLDIRIREWQPMTHGDPEDLKFHVRLCLEGIPLHAWNESIAKRTVASSYVLDYVEGQSLRKEDTCTLNLWAWMADPSYIPKVSWLTISGRSVRVSDRPGHSGLTFRVIVHLDLIEDPPSRDGHRGTRDFRWRLGIIDGERVPRDRHDPPLPNRYGSHRRDDDDDDDDSRGRKEDSWSSRLFRSLSRTPKDRVRDRSEPLRDCHRDRESDAGGRRRQTGVTCGPLALPLGDRRPFYNSDSVGPKSTLERGRSRERQAHRRAARREHSVPRHLGAHCSVTPDPRPSCNSGTSCDNADDARPPSPTPPAVPAASPCRQPHHAGHGKAEAVRGLRLASAPDASTAGGPARPLGWANPVNRLPQQEGSREAAPWHSSPQHTIQTRRRRRQRSSTTSPGLLPSLYSMLYSSSRKPPRRTRRTRPRRSMGVLSAEAQDWWPLLGRVGTSSPGRSRSS